MSERYWQDTTEVYRVVQIEQHKEVPEQVQSTIYGPYGNVAHAKNRRTNLKNYVERYYTRYNYEFYIQKLENNQWFTVDLSIKKPKK